MIPLMVATRYAAERSALARGWELLRDIRSGLAQTGHPLLLGSGAPGLGLHPAHALDDEIRIWRSAGVTETAVTAAIVPSVVALTKKEDR